MVAKSGLLVEANVRRTHKKPCALTAVGGRICRDSPYPMLLNGSRQHAYLPRRRAEFYESIQKPG